MKNITIGFVSQSNPFEDKWNWSGTTYKLREAIERAGYSVRWIPCKNNGQGIMFKIKSRLFAQYVKHCGKMIVGGTHIPFVSHKLADSINKSNMLDDVDILFFPGGAQIAHWLKPKKPYIYFSDANYHQMENYYWANLDPLFRRKARKMEERAIQQAFVNIRSSQWATDSCIRDCGAKPENCHTICFGANLDVPVGSKVCSPGPEETLRVLFSGVEWERKGGDIAVETIRLLNERGIKCKLFIVGIRELPERYKNNDQIENVGFLNKNNPEEYDKYVNLLRSMHVMLLPTKAECAGIVFSEAAMVGMPVFTYNTGGTSDYVVTGVNGVALSLGSSPECFADAIEDCVNGKWSQYHEGALDLFKSSLSWDNWSIRFRQILSEKL